jgi:phosphatidylglycerophosphate synthase
MGRPVLSHLLDQALRLVLPGQPVTVYAREDEHAVLLGLLADGRPGRIVLLAGPPQAGAAVLRADRIYDVRRLRKAVRTGHDVETAAIWRLDRPESLKAADDELKRRLSYQPLGRFWAFALAERLAEALQFSWVRPNLLTLAAAGLMLSSAGLVAFGGFGLWVRISTALALAMALVLDTADGRLARLQGTCSAFGRWLDHVLDELSDVALHAAIAWSMFQAGGPAWWLAVGMLYASGKYMFVIQSVAGAEIDKESTPGLDSSSQQGAGLASRLAGAMGHADVRWHLWIGLGLVGRLDLALAFYAAYFPLRALGGGLRKAVVHV